MREFYKNLVMLFGLSLYRDREAILLDIAISYSKLDSFKNFEVPSTEIFCSARLTLVSGVEIFENDGFLSFTCGQTKVDVFEFDAVMHHILLAVTVRKCGQTCLP